MKSVISRIPLVLIASFFLTSCATIFFKPIQKRQNKNEIPVKIAKGSIGHSLVSLGGAGILGLYVDLKVKGSLHVEDKILTQKLIQEIKQERKLLSKEQAVFFLDSIFKTSSRIKEGYADDSGLFYINDFITINLSSGIAYSPGSTYIKTTYFNSRLKVDYSEIERISFNSKGLMLVETSFKYRFPYYIDFEKDKLDRLIASLLILCPSVKNIVIFNKNYYFTKDINTEN